MDSYAKMEVQQHIQRLRILAFAAVLMVTQVSTAKLVSLVKVAVMDKHAKMVV